MPTAPSPAVPRPAPAPRPLLAQPLFALWLALGVAALAVAVALAVPRWIPLSFLQEGGPVERGTLWAYLAAVLSIALARRSGLHAGDLAAACVLLLAMAAREADLHSALFGISILKSNFYRHAPAGQIAVALGILAPIVLAGLWLLVRHARQWCQPPRRWTAPATSVAVLVAAMVFAKLMDRTPDTLRQLQLHAPVPAAALHVMLALEEMLEFALPLFAIVAVLQGRVLARHGNVTK